MDLIEVDVVDTKSLEAGLGLVEDVLPREALRVGSLPQAPTHLRRDDEFVPVVPGERIPEYLFAGAVVVDVRCIEEVDPQVECALDHFETLLAAGRSTEVHTAQTEPGYFQVSASEGRVRHVGIGHRP